MSGRLGGVQKLVRDVVPRAIYIHCSNHSLDLVLAYASSLQVIKSFFGTVKAVIKFIHTSPKRRRILAGAIESISIETKRRNLVKLCDTRWVEKQSSIIVFRQVFSGIIIAMEYLIEQGDSETSSLARAYAKAILDIDFTIPLIIVGRVFYITKGYTEQFQKPTCDLVKCYQGIEQISTYLSRLLYDGEHFNEVYDEFTTFATTNEIEIRLSRIAFLKYPTVKEYFKEVRESQIS